MLATMIGLITRPVRISGCIAGQIAGVTVNQFTGAALRPDLILVRPNLRMGR